MGRLSRVQSLAIGSSGTASYSNAAPFLITATNELNQRSGLVFYGLASSNVPFQGGTKCVAPPTFRSPIQDSGGSTSGDDCSGSYSFDFNATIQSLFNSLPEIAVTIAEIVPSNAITVT